MHRKRNELVKCHATMFGQEPTVGPAVQSGADKGKWIGPNEGDEGGKETTKPVVNGRESSERWLEWEWKWGMMEGRNQGEENKRAEMAYAFPILSRPNRLRAPSA